MEQATIAQQQRDRFPLRIFLIYVIFYAGQAVYSNFGTLFLTSHGFTQSEIGMLKSIATVLLILVQPLWGMLSDRSKSKNRIVALMIAMLTLSCLAIYASKTAIWLAICTVLFNLFFNPSVTLHDSYTLELQNQRNSKWDFGKIRLGGTAGYMACSAVIGFVIGESSYDSIYWIVAIFFAITAVLMLTCPRVEGHRQKRQKVNYSLLFRHRPMVVVFIFYTTFMLAKGFYQYYPIYYKEIGGTNAMLGIMTTICALSELPVFWFAGKIEKKIGIKNFMMIAAGAEALRCLLLFLISNPYWVFPAQLLTGIGFASFNFCYMNFINKNAPKSMTSTAQTGFATLNMIITTIVGAPIIGGLGDLFGAGTIQIIAAALLIVGIIFFAVAYPFAVKWQKEHPIEGIGEIIEK